MCNVRQRRLVRFFQDVIEHRFHVEGCHVVPRIEPKFVLVCVQRTMSLWTSSASRITDPNIKPCIGKNKPQRLFSCVEKKRYPTE
jgi:hypothetical protein